MCVKMAGRNKNSKHVELSLISGLSLTMWHSGLEHCLQEKKDMVKRPGSP